jgi:hypothetical protein
MDIRPGYPDASGGRMSGAQHPYPHAPLYPPGRRSVQAPAGVQPGARLWERLEAVRRRAQGAASWLQASSDYAGLINRDGVVPVTARFTIDDLAFLGNARGELLSLAEAGLRLIELHQPLDGAGDQSDQARCRSCMWRWPCPSLQILAEALDATGPVPLE